MQALVFIQYSASTRTELAQHKHMAFVFQLLFTIVKVIVRSYVSKCMALGFKLVRKMYQQFKEQDRPLLQETEERHPILNPLLNSNIL